MRTPAISVIVPVYGVELYIEACLRSIAAQTFQDFELILVDDGSKDRSIDIAREFLETTALSWRVLRQENQGLAAAREAGICAANGDWISCIDADDTVSPDFLAELYQVAQTTGVDVAVVDYADVWSPGEVVSAEEAGQIRELSRQEAIHGFLVRAFAPVLPAFLLRRQLIKDAGIQNDKNCRFSEDAYYLWQVFFAAERIAVSDRKLYYYLHHPNSIMTAPKIEPTLTGYRAIQTLVQDHQTEVAAYPELRYVLPRWVLGALRSFAKYAPYADFLRLAEQMEFRRRMKELAGFPEWRARILAPLLRLSPRLFCWIVRTVG